MKPAHILLAEIGKPYGYKGELRINLFSDNPSALVDYGPLHDDSGNDYDIINYRTYKSKFICRIKGIHTRQDAEILKGTQLYVAREALPVLEQGEFYQVELLDLSVYCANKEFIGTVIGIHNFGAGDIIEIQSPTKNTAFMLPFNKQVIPQIDLENNYIIVDRNWPKLSST